MIIYFLCFLLFLIGLYCIIVKKNLLKIIIGLVIIEYAINLFIVVLSYRWDGHAPILDLTKTWTYVDPLPQAMVLTSIVIGLATLILMVGICIKLYEQYGTFDITEIRKLKG